MSAHPERIYGDMVVLATGDTTGVLTLTLHRKDWKPIRAADLRSIPLGRIADRASEARFGTAEINAREALRDVTFTRTGRAGFPVATHRAVITAYAYLAGSGARSPVVALAHVMGTSRATASQRLQNARKWKASGALQPIIEQVEPITAHRQRSERTNGQRSIEHHNDPESE